MAMHGEITPQQLIEQIQALPQDSLDDLATYVEFLRSRANKPTVDDEEPAEERWRAVKLGGLPTGYDIDVSPGRLAEVRREMWRKFEDVEP